MTARRHFGIWLPSVLAIVSTIGYWEWRNSRNPKLEPTREVVGARPPGASARSSEPDQRAFLLAAAANARAERAEQALSELKESLSRQPSDTPAEPNRDPDPEARAAKKAQWRAERAEFLAQLDDRLATEPVDRTWGAEKESAFTNISTKLGDIGVKVEQAECASSVCKIRLGHPARERLSRDAMMRFITTAQEPGSPLSQLAFNMKYENGATIVYATQVEATVQPTVHN